MPIERLRNEDDGTTTVFTLADFPGDGPYHAEIRVSSLDEIRRLRAAGVLIALRMRGHPAGKVQQTNLAPIGEITGL
jgi:hypothetical protein